MFQKLTRSRPSGSVATCDGTLHEVSSKPAGSTIALRRMLSDGPGARRGQGTARQVCQSQMAPATAIMSAM